MSYLPLHPGFNQSLLGVGASPNTFDLDLRDTDQLYGKLHGSSKKNTIVVIIVSALIFITVISLFDIARNLIHNKYAKRALTDPRTKLTKTDITNTLIANHDGLLASIAFSTFCIIITVIVLYLISIFIKY